MSVLVKKCIIMIVRISVNEQIFYKKKYCPGQDECPGQWNELPNPARWIQKSHEVYLCW